MLFSLWSFPPHIWWHSFQQMWNSGKSKLEIGATDVHNGMQVAWDRNTSSMKGKQNKVLQNWDKPSFQYFQYKLSTINSVKLFWYTMFCKCTTCSSLTWNLKNQKQKLIPSKLLLQQKTKLKPFRYNDSKLENSVYR